MDYLAQESSSDVIALIVGVADVLGDVVLAVSARVQPVLQHSLDG